MIITQVKTSRRLIKMIDYKKLWEEKEKEEANFRNLNREWRFNLRNEPENEKLYNLICDLEEEYFSDMLYRENTIASDYLKAQETTEDGEIEDYYPSDFSDSLTLSANQFRYYVEELDENTMGRFIPGERTIKISPKYANDKAVVLHEMIHAYECILDNIHTIYKEILLLCLYNDLRDKIPDLQSRVLMHSHQLTNEHVLMAGGLHGALFLLKTLDLDIKCGFELGTICGYGRDKPYIDETEYLE